FLALLLMACCHMILGQKNDLLTRYEKSSYTESATYEEAMSFYRSLASKYEEITIQEEGLTDSGLPLHVVLFNTSKETNPEKIRKNGKLIFLINNAIHPGEPDGVSASQLFLRELASNQKKYHEVLDKTAIAIIPFYNIGGALNRNSTTRVNQNGPIEYGFRGNARNYDLNRDFIKSDARNSRSFQNIFQSLDPDIFLDTHVSNGADYEHVMMLVHPQKDKMGGPLGKYVSEIMTPYVYQNMNKKISTIYYVNVFGVTPENGWNQFFDLPRYSTGYANLFHTVGFMSETHMLKNYQQRVESTKVLMHTLLQFAKDEGDNLLKVRNETKARVSKQAVFDISWIVDTTMNSVLEFHGYEAEYPISPVTGNVRLKYNREKPYAKKVPYYNTYKPDITVVAPKAYLIPQQWFEVIELFKLNKITMRQLPNDTSILVEAYRITDYKSLTSPYEGHYKQNDVQIEPYAVKLEFRKGDYLVPVNQWRNRFIVETLEPQAPDSYFSWNFFDTILQQKEYFSSYVFEDSAPSILANDHVLNKDFEGKKRQDSLFASNSRMQLDFIYQRSVHKEKAHLRYPIFKIPK
ncbi:MAG: M14 family metallopeptidase, partial [Cytophagales bacterium]|nr:M14 family metallopeptidase [Cytophagales bacterium]